VNADGSSVSLGRDDFLFTTDTVWRSSDSGAVYPIGWNVRLPRFDLVLKVAPLIDNQEMNLTQRYWEGAVSIIGAAKGERIMGAGYVELTGYGE
jgi:predicted secreted hydrolase